MKKLFSGLAIVAAVFFGGTAWGAAATLRNIVMLKALDQSNQDNRNQLQAEYLKKLHEKYPTINQNQFNDPVNECYNLCGWYASFFIQQNMMNKDLLDFEAFKSFFLNDTNLGKIETWLEDNYWAIDDRDKLKLHTLIKIRTSDRYLSTSMLHFSTVQALSGYPVIQLNSASKKTFRDQLIDDYKEVKFNFAQKKNALILGVSAHESSTREKNSGHWIAAIFEINGNNKPTMYIADSYNIDRRDDIVVQNVYDWFDQQYQFLTQQAATLPQPLEQLTDSFKKLHVSFGKFINALKPEKQGDLPNIDKTHTTDQLPLKRTSSSNDGDKRRKYFVNTELGQQWTISKDGLLDTRFYQEIPGYSVYDTESLHFRTPLLTVDLGRQRLTKAMSLMDQPLVKEIQQILGSYPNANIHFFVFVCGGINKNYPADNTLNLHQFLYLAKKRIKNPTLMKLDLNAGIFGIQGASAGKSIGMNSLKPIDVHIHDGRYSPNRVDVCRISELASFWSMAVLPSYTDIKGIISIKPNDFLDETRTNPDIMITYNLIVNNNNDEIGLKNIFESAETWDKLCNDIQAYSITKHKQILTVFADTLRKLGS